MLQRRPTLAFADERGFADEGDFADNQRRRAVVEEITARLATRDHRYWRDVRLDFTGAWFGTHADFVDAVFHSAVSFRHAIFLGDASFAGARFLEEADFSYASFYERRTSSEPGSMTRHGSREWGSGACFVAILAAPAVAEQIRQQQCNNTTLSETTGLVLPAPGDQRRASLTNPPTPIPDRIQALYLSAASRYQLPWTLLAGIGMEETDHGRNNTTSSAGAQGLMQFLPATFARYAVDGAGDEKTIITSDADSIYSAANYLVASGALHGPDGIRGAPVRVQAALDMERLIDRLAADPYGYIITQVDQQTLRYLRSLSKATVGRGSVGANCGRRATFTP